MGQSTSLPKDKQGKWRSVLAGPLPLWVATTASLLVISRYGMNTDKLFDQACSVAHQYGSWQIDELLVTFMFLAVGWLGLAFVRGIKLRREISGRRMAERDALRLARHDPLTGLVNRRVFMQDLNSAVNDGLPFTVVVIDTDDFKAINDLHGHQSGDALLQETAARLQQVLPAQSTIARLGGDEFSALLKLDPSLPRLIPMIEQLLATLRQPIQHADVSLLSSASIGVASYPVDGATGSEILNAADMAMYRVKSDSKDGFRFFESAMEVERLERLRRIDELRSGIINGEIMPYYQPVVHLESRDVCAFEILARWAHPRHGVLPPDQFIQLAEDARLITPLTEALLSRACAEMKHFPDQIRFALNVSPTQLNDNTLATRLLTLLEEAAVPPSRLEVEITEDALVGDITLAQSFIETIRARGTSVALDDFGTGFSSLSYLRGLQFDKIKIDRSFVQNMDTSPESLKLVDIILLLASRFNMMVTAEGIETRKVADMLRERGCALGQGFVFGKPMTLCDATALMSSGSVAA